MALLRLMLAALSAAAAAPLAASSCDSAFNGAAAGYEADGYEAALCYYREASGSGDWSAALLALEQRTRSHPRQAWTGLVAGYVLAESGAAEEALPRYQTAAQRFRVQGENAGELIAMINLGIAHDQLGDASAADTAFERVRALGKQTDDPALKLRALNADAQYRLSHGEDPGALLPVLLDAEKTLLDVSSYWVRRETRNLQGAVQQALGQPQAAAERYRLLAQEAEAAGDLNGLALAQFNAANARLVAGNESPRRADWQAIDAQARRALQTAERAGNPKVQALAHRLLAELSFRSDPQLANRHLTSCRRLARTHRLPRVSSECAWLTARVVAATDPPRARELIREALQWADSAGDPFHAAFATRHLLRLEWQLSEPDTAYAACMEALVVLDQLRARQNGLNGARVLSVWARDYQWLASQALGQAQRVAGAARDRWVERALAVSERARAVGLRSALARSGPSASSPQQPEAPSLTTLRAALAKNEAVLVLSSASKESVERESGGTGWALLLHPEGLVLRTLPDRETVRQLAALLRSQVRRSATLEHRVNGAVHQQLLQGLLREAPAGLQRLIIVADATFALTPFATLLDSHSGRTLVEDLALTQMPSLSLWLKTRAAVDHAQRPVLLAVTNPAAGLADAGLSPLSGAARAAQVLTGLFPTQLTTLTRQAATLTNIQRQLRDEQISVVHFATHAVIENQIPALVLAGDDGTAAQSPGGGRLRAEDLQALPLDSRLVVLAACASAAGEPLRGEGTIGLVRSALIAGARAVIGTLWPVRDDHALAFTGLLYTGLRAGKPVDRALAEAQRQAVQQGLPPEAWAAYVLYGDNRFRLNGAGMLPPLLAAAGGR